MRRKQDNPVDAFIGASLEKPRRSPAAFGLVLIFLVALVSFGYWSVTQQIDEVARAQGQVIASARTQVIQAVEKGVLEHLFVREGQGVFKNELLVTFESERATAAYEDSMNKVAALRAALSRLKAEVYGEKLVFSDQLSKWPEFTKNQRELYLLRKKALQDGVRVLRQSRDLVDEELGITKPLMKIGDVGKTEVIKLEKQRTEIDGQIINMRNKFFQDAQTEMTRVEEELAAQEQLLRERRTLLLHTQVRAPLDGVIKKIEFTTIGATVQAGEVLMEMLPTDSELIVEAKFSPTDIGSLKVGLPAEVKLDAYDPSIFGGIAGKVAYISPDALVEQDPRHGETVFYRVRIELDQDSTNKNDERRAIAVDPGMTATVEVRTRERSVFTYLSKPITKTFSNAFGER